MSDNQDILVSVIVPVFNKMRTLNRCLRSILSQTHRNLDIIIIDDCSSDESSAIARRICRKDSRVRTIELSQNMGLYRARVAGLREAKGEASMFVDADDTIEPRAVELMLNAMVCHQVDLVQMRYRRKMKGLGVKYQECWNPDLADRKIEGLDFRSLASYVGMDSLIYPSCWGKLYRSDILKSLDLVDFAQFWGEDQIFNIQYLRVATSMAFIDYVGYCYFWGGDTSVNYKFSLLKQYKNVHHFKRLMGQSEEYINAEILMLLRYHVRQLMTELNWTPAAIIKILQEELRDPIWKQAGLNLTAEEIVEQESSNVQRSPLKYWIKRLIK